MWPFADKKVWDRLAAASAQRAEAASGDEAHAPVHVSVLTTIIAASEVVSPFTSLRAGLVFVELLERVPVSTHEGVSGEQRADHYDLIGTVLLGDVATLRDADGDDISIVVRRARVEPALPRGGGTAIMRMPPEIAPLAKKATGYGVLCYRELTLSVGDKVRLRAVVEPTQTVVADGYRSGTRVTYLARDDLSPVVLEEVFESPPW